MLAHIDLCSLDLELGLASLVASPTQLLTPLTSLLRRETSRLQALADLIGCGVFTNVPRAMSGYS